MRIIGLLICLFVGMLSYAQNTVVSLNISVGDDDTGKKLGGATVEVLQDGKAYDSKTSATNGKVPLIDLPVGHVYTVYIKKDGYVTKMTQLDLNYAHPEDMPPVIGQAMDISIFKSVEGTDFAWLETTPMAKFSFDPKSGMLGYDEAYTNDQLVKIEKLKQQMEQQRIENEKKEEAEKKKQADFLAYVKAGDVAMTTQKYDVAISQYELALQLIPGDPDVTAKLEDAKKKKADLAESAEKQKAFAAKMEAAKAAYTAKNLEQALVLYKEASAIMPDEALPKERITAIQNELDAQKAKEAKYNQLMAEGQTALDAKLYDDAITKYTAALVEKPGDPTATAKLADAKKLKLEKDQADAKAKETQAKYDLLIKDADIAFNSGNYEVAKAKYKEALLVKPGEAHPTQRLTEIDEILRKKQEELDAANQKEKDYQKLMSEGEALFVQKNWEAAKQKYVAALEIKANDPTALAKIDLINKELEKQKLETQKNEDYNRLMGEAKTLYDQGKYLEAKQKYQDASNVKPDQAEPKNQMIAIDNLLADQKKKEQLELDYKNLMAEGDQLKGIKDYTSAIDRYNKALLLKPGDPVATQKIADINKILEDEKKKLEQEKLYNEYITKADQSFNAKDYTNAKLNYQKAYELKADPAIAQKIKDIDALIAQNQNEAQTQAKYDGLMKEADAFYKAGDYPKALAKYEEASLTKPTEQAPKDKISELNSKINAQNEQAAKDKKFNDFVAAGDAAFTSKDYQTALANYQEALKVKPDPAISQKIGQLNTLITEQNQNLAKDEQYKAKIAEADQAYNNKNWSTALDLYRQALLIKPNDPYSTGRITDTEKQMQAETANEEEANYQKILTKADQLKSEERFDEAISYYNNAKKLKPSDPYPQQKIDEINKIKLDKQNAQQEQDKLNTEYNSLIKEADIAFNTQNYTVALAKYKEALLKKPNDAYAQGRITEINTKLNQQNQAVEVDTEYNNYISQANALFDQQKYLDAIALYRQALGVKPGDAFATNRIDECTRLEQEKSVGEEDKEYQKILTAGQKYFDLGDYKKALEYYVRAKGIRPSDPAPQKKIDEINQILDNQKNDAKFNEYKQQADTYFEKGDWKNAKIYYEKALGEKQDSYCTSQVDIINKKMKAETGDTEEKEYQKILAKADEYLLAKNYEKAISLYERARGFKPDDPYPVEKLKEIDCTLHPEKCTAPSGDLPDYGTPINSTEEEVNAMLMESDEQRQFMTNQKVEQQRTNAEDQNTENSTAQTDETFEAKVETEKIEQNIEEKEWTAEVHRTEANLEVIDMQVQLEETEMNRTENNENDVQHTNQNVTDLNVEIERRDEGNDLPREEYLADVERIKIENEQEESSNSSDQTDVVIDNDAYVNTMQEEHITNDPNNDVNRKNTEVYVEDMEVVLINENNQNAWDQEDDVMGVKDNTEELVDEQIANNVNNDVPREEGIVALTDYTLEYENVQTVNSSNQEDITMDTKTHEEKMSIDIEQNNMDNDIPRQQTEVKVENAELELEENLSDYSSDQNAVVNQTDEDLENIEIGIEEDQKVMDQDRQGTEEDVIVLDQQLQDRQDNLTELNEDNSAKTVEQTEVITDDKVNQDMAANEKATENSDNTNDAVEGIIAENNATGAGNDEEVAATEDYVDGLKNDAPVENATMPNELGTKYPEGVTEEIYAINDENGLLDKYIVRRIVVINGTGYCYEKIQTRYGGVSYTLNGEAISEYQWSDQTEGAHLTRN